MTLRQYLDMHPNQTEHIAKLCNTQNYVVEKWADGYGKPSRFQATMIMQYTHGRVPVKEWGFR